MELHEIIESVGHCGLICSLCHEADQCAGCKSANNCCGRHLRPEGCYQYQCCIAKGIDGCWECEIGPCREDMFGESHDVRNRTFIKVARTEGIDKLAGYVLKNRESGIIYGWNRDYDNLGSEEAVIDLLHNGLKSKYAKANSK